MAMLAAMACLFQWHDDAPNLPIREGTEHRRDELGIPFVPRLRAQLLHELVVVIVEVQDQALSIYWRRLGRATVRPALEWLASLWEQSASVSAKEELSKYLVLRRSGRRDDSSMF